MGSLKFNEMTNSIFFFFNFSFTLEVKEMFPSWYIKNIRFFSSFFFTSGVWEIIYFNA